MPDKNALIIGIGSPKEGKPMDKGEDMNQLCLPAAALAANGDGEATPPSEGDNVDFSVSGIVDHVDGDKVYVNIQKANGQDVEGSKAEEAKETPDEEKTEENGLRSKADAVDNSENNMY